MSPEQFPADHLPEIAFVDDRMSGPPLINCLHQRNWRKSRKTPGKTRAVNFLPFVLPIRPAATGRCHWVDARAMGPDDRTISGTAASLGAVILLIESRVWMPQDVMTIQWVQSLGCGPHHRADEGG